MDTEVTPAAGGWLIARLVAQSLPGFSNEQIVLILAVVGIAGFLLIATRRRIRQAQNSPKTYAREQVSRLRDERSVVDDIEELMVQLEQFSRQMQARLDTKFAKLETVIRDADQRSDRLERLLRQAQGQPSLDITVDGSPADDNGDPPEQEDQRHHAIFQMADAGLKPGQIAEEAGQSIGEVELILALRKASTEASSGA